MEFFTLVYKEVDSKGREKNAKYDGVYKTLDSLEEAKQRLLGSAKANISFQVYIHEHVFNK